MLDWMRKMPARLLAAGAALALAGCSTPRPAESGAAGAARPAMWRVADEDTTIYLFGTFHLLPPGHKWRTPALDKALADSGELVLEIATPDDPAAMAAPLMKLGMSSGLPPLAERVPAEKRDALAKMVAESGVPAMLFDRLETWAASLMLLGVTFKRLGLDPNSGVETQLTAGQKASGKPIRGLETVEEQFGFFDTLPEADQRAFLAAMLDDPEAAKAEFAAMLKAWSEGDVAAMDRIFNEDVSMTAELRDRLLRQRNQRWAEWLAKRLDRPGTVMVAVGAGHLAGRDSVQAMLKAKGIKSKRVQ